MARSIALVRTGWAVSALAGYVRARLKELDKSQNWLAHEAGISESTVSNFLKNNVRPTPRVLRLIAKPLGVPEARLTALAGYAIDEGADPSDPVLRLARQIHEAPWLSEGVEKWMQLPPIDQEEILRQIDFRLSRQVRKG